MTELQDLEAAEYVLGTLSKDERAAFRNRLRDDEDARLAVAAWEKRFGSLMSLVPVMVPPASVWDRIERGLATTSVEALPARTLLVLHRSVRRWRAAAVAATALAASLAIVAFGIERRADPATQPSYVAVVNRGGDEPALVIRVDTAQNKIFVRPVSAETPAGHSLELWYIGNGKAPVTMGVVDKAAQMPIPAALSTERATFAVTVEPPGGSPSGNPTGPVVYSGQLFKE